MDLRGTKRAVNIASDHHLVMTKMKLRIKKNCTTGETALKRFNSLPSRY